MVDEVVVDRVAGGQPGVVECEADVVGRIGNGQGCVAEHGDAARRGAKKAVDGSQRRGLAGAVGAEEPKRLSGLNAEGDVVHRSGGPVALGEMADL